MAETDCLLPNTYNDSKALTPEQLFQASRREWDGDLCFLSAKAIKTLSVLEGGHLKVFSTNMQTSTGQAHPQTSDKAFMDIRTQIGR